MRQPRLATPLSNEKKGELNCQATHNFCKYPSMPLKATRAPVGTEIALFCARYSPGFMRMSNHRSDMIRFMYEDSPLKRLFVIGLFVVSLTFLGLAWWIHETSFGTDPTATLAFYIVGIVGCICFMFGIVVFFIRSNLDI